MENQLVVFNLANEHYGVDIAAVNSIVRMQTVTAVPHAPSFIEGITNLRGEVLPVMSLRKRFGLSPGEDTVSQAAETRIVVVEMDGAKVGMVVDAVSEVLRVSDEDIEPPSPIVTTVDSAFITGIAKVDDGPGTPGRLIILLDLDKVLSTDEQVELQALQQLQDDGQLTEE